MYEHIRIISAVINLIIGTAVAISAHQKYQTYKFPYLKHLVHHVILINGGVFLLLSGKYFELNLMSSWTPEQTSALRDAAMIIAVILLGAMIVKLHALKWSFRREKKRLRSMWPAVVGVLITLAPFPIRYLMPSGEELNWQITLQVCGLSFLITTEIAQQIGMIKYGKVNEENSNLSRCLGWLLLSRYFFLTFILLTTSIFAGWPIPDNIAPFAAFLVLVYLNAVPLIWMNRFFTPHATRLSKLIDKGDILVLFFEEFHITSREQELVRLLLDGKSNKQIEESLFISKHTVKNHLYSIYQKLGIKSRYELVHMITRFLQQRQVT
ncbi:MAG: helix-turn-helix transcriptional regulator [Candidatus Zixiibacteriota bacterium]|nr:MAG: helix-turn-helix transcriptional regulator [candidate division Zixibacteria bacterium]